MCVRVSALECVWMGVCSCACLWVSCTFLPPRFFIDGYLVSIYKKPVSHVLSDTKFLFCELMDIFT